MWIYLAPEVVFDFSDGSRDLLLRPSNSARTEVETSTRRNWLFECMRSLG